MSNIFISAATTSEATLPDLPTEATQQSDDVCLEVECLNGGSCVVLDGGGNVACLCLDGYEGLRCQKDITCKC